MADILNFNPNRTLEFDPNRQLRFDPGRKLLFDPSRPLEFDPNRNLGFGQRGIVFRGYICPICGALTTEDSTSCTECRTVFERAPRAATPPVPAEAREAPPRERTREEPRTALAARKGKSCAFCGAMLQTGDVFCWNCGARSTGGTEAVKLPAPKGEPVTREWRGPRER